MGRRCGCWGCRKPLNETLGGNILLGVLWATAVSSILWWGGR